MSKLYIANVSAQDHVFICRLPEATGQHIQDIRAGGQILFGRNLNPTELDTIISHHRVYGMIEAGEVGKAARGRYCPLVYSVDRPVPMSKLEEQIRINESVLVARGKESRRLAAIQTNDYIERQQREMRLPGRLEEVDLEVVEERRDVASDSSPEIAEGFRVTRSSPSDPTPSRGKPRPRNTGRGRRAA